MQSKKLAGAKPSVSTQKYLDIAQIREDVVLLKDGTLRAVLLVSSINFALKSEDEQTAIIQGYVQFLNGLEYPLQIVIQSRRLNIDQYLSELDDQYKKQENELLKTQIKSYKDFISELIDIGRIMTKRFYLVVPFNPAGGKNAGRAKTFVDRTKDIFRPGSLIKIQRKKFLEYKTELMQRVSIIQSNLNSLGLKSVALDTQSLIELYYNTYNPTVYENEKMNDVNKLKVEGF